MRLIMLLPALNKSCPLDKRILFNISTAGQHQFKVQTLGMCIMRMRYQWKGKMADLRSSHTMLEGLWLCNRAVSEKNFTPLLCVR